MNIKNKEQVLSDLQLKKIIEALGVEFEPAMLMVCEDRNDFIWKKGMLLSFSLMHKMMMVMICIAANCIPFMRYCMSCTIERSHISRFKCPLISKSTKQINLRQDLLIRKAASFQQL